MNASWIGVLLGLAGGCGLSSCHSPDPKVGTNTNWMQLCDTNVECGDELSCECGRCTLPCSSELACPEGSICSAGLSSRLQCGGEETATCQPVCSGDEDCENGRLCQSGVCTDALTPLECPGEALFCTDFESDLGDVTEVITSGNSLSLVSTRAPSGASALSVHVEDGPSTAYALIDLPTQSSGQMFVSGWVRVPEQEAHNIAPLSLWSAAEEGWALRLVVTDGSVDVWSDTAPITGYYKIDGDGWHCLQMAVAIADAPDGSVALIIDGQEMETAEGVDTLPDGGINAVAVGSLWAASLADFFVDRVVVSSERVDCFR